MIKYLRGSIVTDPTEQARQAREAYRSNLQQMIALYAQQYGAVSHLYR